MPRLPYRTDDDADRSDAELAAKMRARRGGELLNLDRMLLHSPPFASGWNDFLGTVRGRLALPAKLRELAMCGVAVVNGAEYEFIQHAPLFIQAGGTRQQADALRDMAAAAADETLFDAAERAAIAVTLELTRDARVSDASFAAARRALGDDRQTVELIGVIAAYNMVSRFLVALQVEPEE